MKISNAMGSLYSENGGKNALKYLILVIFWDFKYNPYLWPKVTQSLFQKFYITSHKGKIFFTKLWNSYPLSERLIAAQKKWQNLYLIGYLKEHSATLVLFTYKKYFVISFAYAIIFCLSLQFTN